MELADRNPPLRHRGEAVLVVVAYIVLTLVTPVGLMVAYLTSSTGFDDLGIIVFCVGLFLGGGTLIFLAGFLAVKRRSASVAMVLLHPNEKKAMQIFNSFFVSSGWAVVSEVIGHSFVFWNRVRIALACTGVSIGVVFALLINYENNL